MSVGKPSAPLSPALPPSVVLDTNTVLDWLVFRNPAVEAAAAAIGSGTLRWLACSEMRDELARTLKYRCLAKWNPDSEHTLATFDRHATLLPRPCAAPQNLRCSDPDDQVFLDLGLEHRARWLLTHDRALLRLAKRARPYGVSIVQARHFAPD